MNCKVFPHTTDHKRPQLVMVMPYHIKDSTIRCSLMSKKIMCHFAGCTSKSKELNVHDDLIDIIFLKAEKVSSKASQLSSLGMALP